MIGKYIVINPIIPINKITPEVIVLIKILFREEPSSKGGIAGSSKGKIS